MDLERLLSTYGYWAVLIGTLLEGETILVLAGFAAHRGYLSLPLVMLMAVVGSVTGDQFYFWIGRRRGSTWLDAHPTWKARAEKVRARLDRHPVALILGFRFVYGVRTVSPFVIGASGVSFQKFTPLNVLGAALWASLVGGIGYLFGEVAERALGEVKRYEGWLLGGVILVGAAVWLVNRLRQARAKRSAAG